LILLLAVCTGLAVGVLTAMAHKGLPEAVLAGILASGSSAVVFNTIIGT
jgi:ABC-type antimicrobial peptide transport system permease subunit